MRNYAKLCVTLEVVDNHSRQQNTIIHGVSGDPFQAVTILTEAEPALAAGVNTASFICKEVQAKQRPLLVWFLIVAAKESFIQRAKGA